MPCCKELTHLEKIGGFHSDTNELYEYNELLDDYVVFKLKFCPFCGMKLRDEEREKEIDTGDTVIVDSPYHFSKYRSL